MFGPTLIDQLKHAVSKNCAQRGFFLQRQPRNFENVTLVARRRKCFWGFWSDFFIAELPQKRGCFSTQEFTRFLSTGVVSKVTRSDVSFQAK